MSNSLEDAYRDEARKADEKAERASDIVTAKLWRLVADDYRTLADGHEVAGFYRWS